MQPSGRTLSSVDKAPERSAWHYQKEIENNVCSLSPLAPKLYRQVASFPV